MRKQIPTAELIAEYERLSDTMLQSVYRVDFPFGIVARTRARMDEIERRYWMPSDAKEAQS
jgi:hypothetical protein